MAHITDEDSITLLPHEQAKFQNEISGQSETDRRTRWQDGPLIIFVISIQMFQMEQIV